MDSGDDTDGDGLDGADPASDADADANADADADADDGDDDDDDAEDGPATGKRAAVKASASAKAKAKQAAAKAKADAGADETKKSHIFPHFSGIPRALLLAQAPATSAKMLVREVARKLQSTTAVAADEEEEELDDVITLDDVFGMKPEWKEEYADFLEANKGTHYIIETRFLKRRIVAYLPESQHIVI